MTTHDIPTLQPIQQQALLALGGALRARKYQFTTVTPATQARVLARPVAPQMASLRDIFGWSRPFTADAVDAELLACMRAADVVAEHDGLLRSTVRVSTLAGEWLFHSAYPTTQADAVFFGPDTARFVRAMEQTPVPARDPVRRIVDIGCGSGVAAITLARRFPQSDVLAVDINDRALALADINIRLAGVNNAAVHHSNLLNQLDGVFDLIVANPPYLLDATERAYRHGGGELGAGLSLQIVQAAINRLASGGALWLYTGVAVTDGDDPFFRHATALLDEAGLRWTYEEIDPDVFGEELETPAYAGADRIAAVWLVASRDA
ncbi:MULTISPECIES: class I SAM-dependent methyltransferase [unclassified Duganella]|uniref:N5-glutamine methyltransferase family protein n=1 Tax=unclassified Duganella TaxID=2636909 RepID=UPI00088C7F25|nr:MULTISPECIES: class I SAM-dependent methyltransferase [unclassified Duganella]SDG42942.1 HemK family putative methylases [Duganella sp. OV458]SDJ61048.1 HemK family putative methylases [Duganella sp. OV510]